MGRVTNDTQADWAAAYALFPGDVAYVWHAALFADVVMAGLRQAEFEVRSQIVWAKPTFVLGRGAYHWQHEPAWYAVRQGRGAPWYGGRAQSTVWEVPVVSKDLIDDPREGAQLRTPDRLVPAIPRRQPVAQHLAHRLASQPKAPRGRAFAQPLHIDAAPHLGVELHSIHPSCVPQHTLGMLGGPLARSGFPPPSGCFTPPRCGPFSLASTALGIGPAKRPRAQVLPEDPILLPKIRDQIVSVSNSSSGRRWKLDHAPAVGDPTHMVEFGTGRSAFAREA